MDYVLFWPETILNLKHRDLNGGFASKMQLFTSQDINLTFFTSFGLLVDYCNVFISCLDSHSDGTHSLQMIHWGASDVMLHFSISVPMKQTHLHLGWPEGVQIKFLGELLI